MSVTLNGTSQGGYHDSFGATKPMTFNIWFKTGVADVMRAMMAASTDTNSYPGAILANNYGGAQPLGREYDSTGNLTEQAAGASWTSDTWQMATCVYDSTICVYVNGASSATTTPAQTVGSLKRYAIGLWYNNSQQHWWSGKLAEAAVWDVALASSDVTVLWNSGVSRSSTLVIPGSLSEYHSLVSNWNAAVGTNLTDIGGGSFTTDHPGAISSGVVMYPGFWIGAQ